MALIAESLVEEWLNRQGFFTVRGVKLGREEMDLLAVRPSSRKPLGWHVEVTVSFGPIGYISPAPTERGGRTDFVRKRTPAQVRTAARAWVDKKFRAQPKAELRERLWPGVSWSFHLVHGATRYPEELAEFSQEGVTCHPFHALLSDLTRPAKGGITTSAGGDLADIVAYCAAHMTDSS